jgi:hypothetical protein
MAENQIAELRDLRSQYDAAREKLSAAVRQHLQAGASPALVARSVNWSREHVSKIRVAEALLDFRRLGHDVDERYRESDAYGRPQWACRRCGHPLSIDGSGQRWISPSGTGRCLRS